MNTEIKNTVKNLFSTLKFEDALEATKSLRGEYIKEFGVKSWNGLVSYYKKANIQPEVAVVAEPKTSYQEAIADEPNVISAKTSKKELKKELKGEFDKKIKDIYESLKDNDGSVKLDEKLEAFIALQDEYLAKYGVMLGDKNWRRALDYYRKASEKYEIKINEDSEIYVPTITPENIVDLHDTRAGILGDKPVKTPLMKQYEEMKTKHPDAILLFRVGDFYETFSEDAIVASEILGITLTKRANGKAQSVELAGFPHHALDTYLPKLIRAGKRVAICEQLEDPKQKMKFVEKVSPQQNDDTYTKEGLFSDELATSSQEGDTDILYGTITPDNVGELHNTLAGIFGEDQESTDTKDTLNAQEKSSANELSENVEEQEEERVEYMLYQNDGEKIDWYGHFVNYKGLKVGEVGFMVRMNNLGVGRGKVLATASMTMNEIGMFHKCYAYIRQNTASDKKRVELFTKAFNNLQKAMRDSKFVSLSKNKEIANFVINYKEEN